MAESDALQQIAEERQRQIADAADRFRQLGDDLTKAIREIEQIAGPEAMLACDVRTRCRQIGTRRGVPAVAVAHALYEAVSAGACAQPPEWNLHIVLATVEAGIRAGKGS